MNKRNISMVAILLVMVSVGVFAATDSDLRGSDFVRLGQLGIVSGTLSEVDGEGYLNTTDTEYALHLGNYEVIYPKGINLKEGSEAIVTGFVLNSDISAITVGTHEASYSFRTAEGMPLWAGQGERQNQQAFQNVGKVLGKVSRGVPVAQGRQATFQSVGQGMQNRQTSFHNPRQGMQGRQGSYQSQGQGRQMVQRGPQSMR